MRATIAVALALLALGVTFLLAPSALGQTVELPHAFWSFTTPGWLFSLVLLLGVLTGIGWGRFSHRQAR